MSERISAQFGYGRLITPREIEIITGYDEEAAKRDHAFVRESLGTKSDDLMVGQYCEFYGLNSDEVLDAFGEEQADPEDDRELFPDEDEDFKLPTDFEELINIDFEDENTDFEGEKNDKITQKESGRERARTLRNDNDLLSRSL